jgi:ABC-type branched-subunit amino acid transport system permease subunit
MAFGGLELLTFFFVGIGSFVLGIYTAVDAARYPDWAFQRTGTSRTLWIVLPIVFIVVCGLGALVMGLIWLTSKRQQVEAAMITAGYPSPRGKQPPWMGPPPADGPPPPPPGPPSVPPPYQPPTQ